MPIIPMIEALLKVTGSICDYLNLKEQRKYLNKVFDLKLEILDEIRKGDLADQAKIVSLQDELVLAVDAMQKEITLALAHAK